MIDISDVGKPARGEVGKSVSEFLRKDNELSELKILAAIVAIQKNIRFADKDHAIECARIVEENSAMVEAARKGKVDLAGTLREMIFCLKIEAATMTKDFEAVQNLTNLERALFSDSKVWQVDRKVIERMTKKFGIPIRTDIGPKLILLSD